MAANFQDTIFSRAMYGTESTYATAATRTSELSRIQSIDPNEDNGFIYEKGLGEGLNVVKTYNGPYNCGANVVFNVNDFDFLKHGVGGKSGAGSVGDPYVLNEATGIDVTNSDTTINPFSFEYANVTEGDDVIVYTGCIINDFSLTASVGSILSCNANLFGSKSNRPGSATSYSAVTENSYIMLGGSWKFGTTPSEVTGIREFTINYTNGLTPDDFRNIDSRFISMPTLGAGRSYTGSVTVATNKTTADSIYDTFYGQSGSSGPASDTEALPNIEFEIDLINNSKYATLWLDQCSIDNITRGSSIGGGLMLLTFSFTAKSAKDAKFIRWWTV